MATTRTKKDLEKEIEGLKQTLQESGQGQDWQFKVEQMKKMMREQEQKIDRLQKRVGRVKQAGEKLYAVSEDLARVFDNFARYAVSYNSDSKMRAQVEMLRHELTRARGAYRREK